MNSALALLLAYIVFLFAGLYGWGMNLWHVVQAATGHADLTVTLALQAIGIPVAPLGIILGWLL